MATWAILSGRLGEPEAPGHPGAIRIIWKGRAGGRAGVPARPFGGEAATAEAVQLLPEGCTLALYLLLSHPTAHDGPGCLGYLRSSVRRYKPIARAVPMTLPNAGRRRLK